MTRLPGSGGADGQRGHSCTTVQQRLLQHLHHVLIALVQTTGGTPAESEIPTGVGCPTLKPAPQHPVGVLADRIGATAQDHGSR